MVIELVIALVIELVIELEIALGIELEIELVIERGSHKAFMLYIIMDNFISLDLDF